eukprot:m.66695 g.66695  ORF g.66695 m.66695 type:complete len:483 (+) comp23715_c0_seq2:191-1639(+)
MANQPVRTLLMFVLSMVVVTPVRSLDNGLALTPQMGLSTWSVFRTGVNDSLIRELADAMVSSGLSKAGYNYLLVDDGWEGQGCTSIGCLPNRDENNRLVVDPTKFPLGLNATAKYVHSKGLKFGLWFGHSMCTSSNDTRDTNGVVAYEYTPTLAKLDAELFAANGVDAIKHDNCVDVANTTTDIATNYARYAALSAAMNATGRPIYYDVVLQVAHNRTSPSYDYGYLWSPEVYGKEAVKRIANSWWSLPVNKYNCWSCCVGSSERIIPDTACTSMPTGRGCRRGLLPMIDTQDMGTPGFSKEGHWDYGGPGGWNHIDQLAACVGESWYGPGLTDTEQVSQFSLWAVLASPLLVSMDVRTVSSKCLSFITNPRAIAVHQDSAGVPGRRLKNIAAVVNGSSVLVAQLWGRPLVGGAVAAIMFNRGESELDIASTFTELGLAAAVKTVTMVDVWSGEVTKGVTSPVVAKMVQPHGVTFVTLTPDS